MSSTKTRRAAVRELDELFDGASPYYGQLTARYSTVLLCSFAAIAGLGHAALTADVPLADRPSRGWCVVYAEGEMELPRQDFADWCDAHHVQ